MKQKMLRKVFIINNGGVCMYFVDLSQIQTKFQKSTISDPQLISGFFSAIMAFGEEMSGVSDNAEKKTNIMLIKSMNYTFCKSDQRFFVVESDRNDRSLAQRDIEEFLFYIVDIFDLYVQKGIIDESSDREIVLPEMENDIRAFLGKIVRRSLLNRTSS
jgi:hypothetical protein